MNKIPVIALKNKSKEGRYLAASMDAGDWDDPDLDVTIDNIECAFLIWRKGFSTPNELDIEQLKDESRQHKENLIRKFGSDAFVSFDVEAWLEIYDPVDLEITKDQLEKHIDYSE